MAYWDELSPGTQSLYRWIAADTAKRLAPPTPAREIWPHLPSVPRSVGAPVAQGEGNVSAAAALYPHLKQKEQ